MPPAGLAASRRPIDIGIVDVGAGPAAAGISGE